MLGDTLPDTMYLKIVEHHCEFALDHHDVIEAAIRALRENDPRSSTHTDAAFVKVVPAVVGCLTHAALVSGFLFPTSAMTKDAEKRKSVRCEHLRNLLGVDTPVLKNRNTRNALIHMDERLDALWSSWQGDKIVWVYDEKGYSLKINQNITSVITLDYFSKHVEIFGDMVDLEGLRSDLLSIKSAIVVCHKKMNESAYEPLWHKFRKLHASATDGS